MSGDGGDVVNGIGDVFGVDLDVVQLSSGDGKVDWVSVAGSREQLPKVGAEVLASSSCGTRNQDDGRNLPVCESGRNVDGTSQRLLRHGIRSVIGILLWVNSRHCRDDVDVVDRVLKGALGEGIVNDVRGR